METKQENAILSQVAMLKKRKKQFAQLQCNAKKNMHTKAILKCLTIDHATDNKWKQ